MRRADDEPRAALLYLAEMAQAIGVAKDEPALRDRVQQAIYRILAMQSRDGGFGMWSSHDEGAAWLTAFIMDFLPQARAKGYIVPDIAFEQGLKRLDSIGRDLSYEGPTLPVLAYAHYVLAANKRATWRAAVSHDTQLKECDRALEGAVAAGWPCSATPRAQNAFDAARAPNTGRVRGTYYRPLVRTTARCCATGRRAGDRQHRPALGTTLDQVLYRAPRPARAELSQHAGAGWLLLARKGSARPRR